MIRRFVFTLQPLLRTRLADERARQRELAGIEGERVELEERLRRRQQQITDGRDVMRAELTGALRIDDIRRQGNAGLHALREAHRTVLALAGVHRRRDAARAELVEARRHRRAVELLRERQYARWKKARNKIEIGLLDELATSAAAHKERDA